MPFSRGKTRFFFVLNNQKQNKNQKKAKNKTKKQIRRV